MKVFSEGTVAEHHLHDVPWLMCGGFARWLRPCSIHSARMMMTMRWTCSLTNTWR